MRDFEPRFRNVEVVKFGQKFPVFTERTEDLRGAQTTDATRTNFLAYRTPLVLDVGHMRIPFQAEFGYTNYEVAQTLAPFHPGLAYQITAEDFDPHKRSQKLIDNMDRYSRWLQGRTDILRFSMSNLVNPTSNPDNPMNLEYDLRLLLDLPGGGLIGFPIESENRALHINSFFPTDTPQPARMLEGDNDVMEQLEEKYGANSREYQFVAFINEWFDLALPDDPAKLKTITGEFVLDDSQRRYRLPNLS